MIETYIYKGEKFDSEQAVRKVIFDQERKALPKNRKDSPVEFWSKYGVTHIEEQEPIETLKAQKSFAIKQAFLNWRNNAATLISSLGFKADSNERANTDVSGLLVAYDGNQEALIAFRDADNQFHELTYLQMKTLQKEIIANGNYAYIQKWAFDAQVESATTKEELDAIEVKFVGKDFSEVISDVQ